MHRPRAGRLGPHLISSDIFQVDCLSRGDARASGSIPGQMGRQGSRRNRQTRICGSWGGMFSWQIWWEAWATGSHT